MTDDRAAALVVSDPARWREGSGAELKLDGIADPCSGRCAAAYCDRTPLRHVRYPCVQHSCFLHFAGQTAIWESQPICGRLSTVRYWLLRLKEQLIL
eukprot:6213593-Pleurochrysis_carterae.AAC.2